MRKSGKITDSFLAAVAVLISRAKEKAENLKMDQALERYKRSGEMKQDIIIVGAGPAGLMAALKLAELGTKPLVVEMKNNMDLLNRACSMQFRGFDRRYAWRKRGGKL